MNRLAKRRASAGALAFACAVFGAVVGYQLGSAQVPQTDHPSATVIVKPSSVTDVSEPRKLAGLAQAVFVGRVEAATGTKSLTEGLPESQFRVTVLKSLKGDLAGTVTINQQGGISKVTGQLVVFENDTIVNVGDTYLFAALHNGEHDWYTIIPVYGDQQLPDGEELSESKLVATMVEAVKNQIHYQEPNTN